MNNVNLKNLKDLTEQEVYSTVRHHLLTQMKQAADVFEVELSPIDRTVETSCRYRTAEGLTCAVGCLIPDNLYDESLEGSVASGVLDTLQLELNMTWDERRRWSAFLDDLQVIHDQSQPEHWETQLNNFAKCRGLQPC